jgi:hypothetical protein
MNMATSTMSASFSLHELSPTNPARLQRSSHLRRGSDHTNTLSMAYSESGSVRSPYVSFSCFLTGTDTNVGLVQAVVDD